MSEPIIATNSGRIRGALEDGVYTFKGVPYGRSTAGEDRFLPARSPVPWSGVRDALEFGPKCPQVGPGANPNPKANPLLGTNREDVENEDCLVLNVWSPGLRDSARRPVMVWLHGGGYASGSGSNTMYDGISLCKRGDVVVVTVNHRINIFGFLHLAGIAGDAYAGSGMAGMLDTVLALEWVRDNIEALGGDPDNVTIFGESGGGRKVSILLAMPAAKGLFHRAIIQSSPGLRGKTAASATDFAKRLLVHLNLRTDQIDRLQNLPAQQLLRAVNALPSSVSANAGNSGVMRLSPVVDGHYLPAHPFDPVAISTIADVPILIGTNRDESSLFVAGDPRRRKLEESELAGKLRPLLGDRLDHILDIYRETRPDASPWDLYVGLTSEARRLGCIQLVERKLAVGNAPIFMYLFTWESDYLGYLFRAAHALEIPFVFDNIDSAAITGDRPDRQALADSMSETWISFARNGDPNHPGIPQWAPYTRAYRETMIFDVPCRTEKDPAREERKAWDGMDIIV